MPARVAIIGAGPCGISLLKAFQDAKAQLSQPVDVVCFEKQGDWGGMWNLTWQTGLDQHGEPVHTGMYRHLYSNGPKECIEYPDYTFDEHFKRPIESFPRREKIHEYILARAEKSNIRHNIRFNTVMKYVKYDSSKEKFTATAFSFDSSKTFVEDFDYVIVATSHFSTPQLASIQGLNEFPGRILHSHDFRDACQFTGQDVLVVGNSSSGEDIALQLYKFGSRFVTITYRSMRTDLTWPPGIEEAPPLLHLEGSFAHFSDGKRKSYDAIILCTGYIYHFPFLDDNLRLESTNRYYPSLYKGVLFPTLPKLAYMGMQNLYFTLTLFEAQAWYIRDMILGRLVVPDAANRASSIVEWQTREASLSGHADEINFQAAYIEDLLSSVQDRAPLHVAAAAAIFIEYEEDRERSIVRYRDKPFVSVFTGTLAAPPRVPWIDADGAAALRGRRGERTPDADGEADPRGGHSSRRAAA